MAENHLYPDAGKRAVPEVREAIARFRKMPKAARAMVPLRFWLLGTGTPDFKMEKVDAQYTEDKTGKQTCGNCEYAYKTAQGDFICSWVRGEIRPQDWCKYWIKASA